MISQVIIFVEPELHAHLEEIVFEPQHYAVGWLFNIFSSILNNLVAFTVEQVLRIWDLVVCNVNFISVFAAVLMCDLK